MEELTAQLASARVLHLRGRFDADAPRKLLDVEGIRQAYLVPHGSGGAQCMVVEPAVPSSVRRMFNLVSDIANQLGCKNVKLLRAVERSDAGQQALDVFDWGRLRS